MITWSYTIADLRETFTVQANDVAELAEIRAAVLTLSGRLAHNEEVLLRDTDFQQGDFCGTWLTTHQVTHWNHTYHMCETGSCQKRAAALAQQHAKTPSIVIALTRQDLRDAGFTDEQIAGITDKDMQRIASRLEDILKDDEWEDNVYVATTLVLEWNEPLVTEEEREAKSSTSN